MLFFFGLNKITAGPADTGVEPTRNNPASILGSCSKMKPESSTLLSRYMDIEIHINRLKVVRNRQIGTLPLRIGPLRQQKKRIANDHTNPKKKAPKSRGKTISVNIRLAKYSPYLSTISRQRILLILKLLCSIDTLNWRDSR